MKLSDATQQALKEEAEKILGRTLDEQGNDELDFPEVHVLLIMDALKAAYAMGFQQGRMDSQ